MRKVSLHAESPAHDFAGEINSLLMERFGYRTRCVFCTGGEIVEARTAKLEISLRFPKGFNARFESDQTLVIARIQFKKVRTGHGSWLLGELVDLSQKYGYKNIAVESAGLHAGIQNFVRKFGFSPFPSDVERPRDWIASVGELEARLFPRRERFPGSFCRP